MKAKINGIEVEGTPEEIKEFQEITKVKSHDEAMDALAHPYNYFGVDNIPPLTDMKNVKIDGLGHPVKTPNGYKLKVVHLNEDTIQFIENVKDELERDAYEWYGMSLKSYVERHINMNYYEYIGSREAVIDRFGTNISGPTVRMMIGEDDG